MTKQLFIGAVIILISVVIAIGLVVNRSKPPQRAVENLAPLVQVVPAVIQSGALKVSGSGTVRPRAEVSLAAQVSGKVVFTSPSLVSGSYVRKGEILVRIDPSDFDNTVQQARADVAQQEVSVLQAQEEADIARAEYSRFKDRENRRSNDTFASVDSNDYAAQLIAGRSTSGEKSLSTDSIPANSPGGLVFREPQLRAAKATLQRSQALLANAELSSSRTIIRAPFSGFVRSKNVAVGSFLAPGQSFAQLVASDIYEIAIPMTREEAALIPNLWANRTGKGNAAVVYADYGGARYGWDGYIDRAEAVLDPATRTINVVVRVPNPISGGKLVSDLDGGQSDGAQITTAQAPPLLVGEFVDVSVDGGAVGRYLVIPRSALKADNSVWVVRNGAVDIVTVRVLQQADEQVFVVADAISAGDEIVVSDMTVVTPGMKVRVASESRSSGSGKTAVREIDSSSSIADARAGGLVASSPSASASN